MFRHSDRGVGVHRTKSSTTQRERERESLRVKPLLKSLLLWSFFFEQLFVIALSLHEREREREREREEDLCCYIGVKRRRRERLD